MDRKRKAADILFGICFVAMIFTPFLLLDTGEEVNSALENRALTKWPGLHFDKLHTEWYGHYVEDRVAFRDAAITFNADISYYLFGEFSEELHMPGKEGYIFPADEGYVQNYQRLNIDEGLMDDLMVYLSGSSAYVEKQGGFFVCLIAPNKSSVYGEYMPEGIHVDETRESTLDMAARKLKENGIPHVVPHRAFWEIKERERLYNKKYDCAHWNDLGAFYGLSMVDEVIREVYPDIPVMERKDFEETNEVTRGLEFFAASEEIPDTVPYLTCTAPSLGGVASDSPYRADVPVVAGNNMAYFYNENAASDKCVLILHDSFLDSRESWYTYRYREVYYASRVNYTYMKEYIDLIKPDVVIFELAERSFADDLGAYTELSTLSFE